MYRFFIDSGQIDGDIIRIIEGDLNHMKNVLRLRPGKELSVSDGSGRVYICHIDRYDEDAAILTIDERMDASAELPVVIDLFQGLPKKDKMELVIQKAVELGVASVTPVTMKRSVVKLDDKARVKKTTRWQSIADAAAKQAKRDHVPRVHRPCTVKEMMTSLENYDMILVPYEDARGIKYTREVLSEVKSCDRIGIIIGPEGGFDPLEIEGLRAADARIITLGRRILRTETAGLALLSYLMIDLEEE